MCCGATLQSVTTLTILPILSPAETLQLSALVVPRITCDLPQILVMIFSTQLVSLILHKQVSAAFAQRLRNLSNSS